jgi:endonuclease/exonuclease/phosphatase (EEP) superfamily protein YafD
MTTSATAPPPATPDPVRPRLFRRSQRPRRPGVSLLVWGLAAIWGVIALMRITGVEFNAWPFALGPALTPYAAVAAIIPLAVGLATRRWLAAVLALAAMAALVGAVAPRAFGQPDPVRGPVVRVLAANVNEGGADPAALLNLVRTNKVDLLSVEELTDQELAALQAAGIESLLPYSQTNPHDTSTGTGLFSRYPLTDGGRRRLISDNMETFATVQVPGAQPVLVNVIHYCAPVDPFQTWCWSYGVQNIPLATPKGTVQLLLGDFNLTMDYPALRNILGSGYRDAASVVGNGLQTTWPYNGLPLPKVTIDHVLADQRIGVSATDVYPLKNSDHRALYAELTLPRA